MLISHHHQSRQTSLPISPLAFPANLLFLLGAKVVLDVEGPANLLCTHSRYDVRHSLAGQVQQVLYVQIVRSLKQIKIRNNPSMPIIPKTAPKKTKKECRYFKTNKSITELKAEKSNGHPIHSLQRHNSKTNQRKNHQKRKRRQPKGEMKKMRVFGEAERDLPR